MIQWSVVLTGFGVGLFGGCCASLINTIIATFFRLMADVAGKE